MLINNQPGNGDDMNLTPGTGFISGTISILGMWIIIDFITNNPNIILPICLIPSIIIIIGIELYEQKKAAK